MSDREVTFRAPGFELESGVALADATLIAKTYGELSEGRDNVIVFTTKYGATHVDNEFLIGPGRVLDTDRYFVVSVNMLGAGLSSSPSNTAGEQGGPGFPLVTVYDNVVLQRRMLDELFDVRAVELVLGASMGGLQAYHWAVRFPELVRRIAVICGACRISAHNVLFLEGMRTILRADPTFADGAYAEPPRAGLRAMGAAWAPWALSPAFYRDERHRELGYETARAFVDDLFEGRFLGKDANDLLAQIATWQAADVGTLAPFAGSTEAALASIEAQTVLMPGTTDQYFKVDDCAWELSHLRRAKLAPIPSDWGHWAGNHVDPAAVRFMEHELGVLLATPAHIEGERHG